MENRFGSLGFNLAVIGKSFKWLLQGQTGDLEVTSHQTTDEIAYADFNGDKK